MLHPQGKISSADYGNYMGDLSYSMAYDGKHFIYSFFCEDELYKVDPASASVEKIPATSQYLSPITFKKRPEDLSQTVKALCETASYTNILYDKYRKVYYRFANPETELENNFPCRRPKRYRSGAVWLSDARLQSHLYSRHNP